MAKKKLVIFPFNGNGIEALDCIDYEQYDLIGFVDDDAITQSNDYEIFSRAVLEQYRELYMLAVPGSANTFKQRQKIISSLNVTKFINAIHARASIGKSVKIGYNCLIMAGAVVTSNAWVGNHVCILPNTVIHHDVVIKDYTLIGSNVVIAGGTRVGMNCYIGSGTNIINGITIGDVSLIGLGSNVIKSVCSHSRVAGNPAKELNACPIL